MFSLLVSILVFILVLGVFMLAIRAALAAFFDPPLNRKWGNLIYALVVLLLVLAFLSYLGLIPGYVAPHRVW